MKLEFNVVSSTIKDLYNYVEYCIVEEYEGSDVYSYNATTYGLYKIIFAGMVGGGCAELITSTIIHPLGSEISVDFAITSEDGRTFEIEYLGQSENSSRDMLRYVENRNKDELRDMAIRYAEFHHGERTESNHIRFDDEIDKFIRGVSYML